MRKNKILSICCFIILLVGTFSCNDKWDDHYTVNPELKGKDLLTTLNEYPELSKFVEMLKISKLDQSVAGVNVYTIWAPDNEALRDYVLTNLNASDSLKITLFVQNHVARYLHSTSEVEFNTNKVVMLNDKKILFAKEGAGFVLGEDKVTLSTSNIPCSNGVLHILKGSVPYQINIWEHFRTDSNLKLMYDYISLYDSTYMDEKRSPQIGVDEFGYNVYDTVFIMRNLLMDKIGQLYDEDSIYTCIAPSNTAYKKAFDEYSPYFISNGGPNGLLNKDSVKLVRASNSIVKDLIFRGDYDQLRKDSIVSTGGNVFYTPSTILAGTRVKASNGTVIYTENIQKNPYESFCKPIEFEMEHLAYYEFSEAVKFTFASGSILYPTVNTTIQGLSGGYLYFTEISTSGTPVMQLLVEKLGHDILSTKHDLFVTFIPGNVEDPANVEEQTILDFTLVYKEGKTSKRKEIRKGFITHKTKLEEVLIAADFEMPSCDSGAYIEIKINVPVADRNKYKRAVRMDNFRLVPKQK